MGFFSKNKKAPALGKGNKLPKGWEWYGLEGGGGAPQLGDPVETVVLHDGREINANSPEVFPAGMFADRDDLEQVWGSGWSKGTPEVGDMLMGVLGSPFEDYYFIWRPDGSHGGRWARPVKGKK